MAERVWRWGGAGKGTHAGPIIYPSTFLDSQQYVRVAASASRVLPSAISICLRFSIFILWGYRMAGLAQVGRGRSANCRRRGGRGHAGLRGRAQDQVRAEHSQNMEESLDIEER